MSKVLPLVMIIVMTLSACGKRTASMPGEESISNHKVVSQIPPTDQAVAQAPAVPQSDLAMSTITETTDKPDAKPSMPAAAAESPVPAIRAPVPAAKSLGTAIEAPAAAVKAPAAKAVVVQPSRSLAGHDRFLVSRPFGTVRPADFELGPLMDRTIEPSFTPLLEGLSKAMVEKKLETAAFSSQGLVLARLLYDTNLASAPAITRVRYSQLRRMPGTSYALAFRLFSELGFADGLALLGSDDSGNWLIEHLDLELDGLDKPATRSESWDPYGYSRNLME